MRALLMTAEKKWQPGANTLCYLPIDNNDTTSIVYDHSGNGNNFSCTNCSFQTLSSGKRVLSLSDGYLQRPAVFTSPVYTINMWFFASYQYAYLFSQIYINNSYGHGIEIYNHALSIYDNRNIYSAQWTRITGARYNICCTINNSGNQKVYINGAEVTSSSNNPSTLNMGSATTYLGYNRRQQTPSAGRMGAVILEAGNRTEQEVLDYYNSTKSYYGLS